MEALNDDNIAGWSFLAMLVLLAIAVAISGCSVSQPMAEAAEMPARFEVESAGKKDGAVMLDYMAVDIVTDTETGQQWVVVCTTHGTAMAPIEGSGDGAVSDQL